MAYTKYIFKLLILVQLLACTFATYGHPDAEFIDFGSPTQPSRDQMIIEAAIKRGMDGDAVAELLRTRQPVVRTTTTPSGFTKTTTYKMEPDGSISSKSILQKRNRFVYNADSIPDDLKNSPTGTVTRTFTDSDGNKVTQTMAVSRDKTQPSVDTDDLSGDWFSKPFASWPEDTPASPSISTNQRTVSRTFTAPNGERTRVQSWSSEPDTNNTPNFRRTSMRTFTSPNGEKHVIQSAATSPDTFNKDHKPKFPLFSGINWPNFDDTPSWNNKGIADDDEDGWEVVDDAEATTKKNNKSWSSKTWEWPEFPTFPTTTTTTTTPKPTGRSNFPTFDDFLITQYGRPANRESTTSTTKTIIQTPKYETTTTPKSSTTTPKFIKIEDLPVAEILLNGQTADESFLRTLPAHLTPHTPTGTVLSIEHKHPIEEDVDSFTPNMEKNIRSYSTTHIGPEKPRLKDLDPQMQDILKNAGIVPEIEGDAVTKTRTEPDGRVITTTYKVNTLPSTSPFVIQTNYIPNHQPTYKLREPLRPLKPLRPIADFLARLGLTRIDLMQANDIYTETIADGNGDVLTATFELTSGRKG